MAEQNIGEQNPGSSTQQQQGQSGGQQQQQQQQTPPGGQQGSAASGAGGTGDKTFSFKEDRSDWIPPHRLSETSRARQTAEQERDRLKADLEERDRKIQALAGVTPKDAKTAEAEEIRAAILNLVPEIGLLKGLTQDQLGEILEAARSARNTSNASWERHAIGMFNDLYTEAATAMHADTLTEKQQGRLQTAYWQEAQQALNVRQAQLQRGERETLETTGQDNDFIARHERGDKALVKEFVKDYLNDWYEPARRTVTAENARRNMRPVPRGERTRLIPAQGEEKLDLNKDADFKKALTAARAASE